MPGGFFFGVLLGEFVSGLARVFFGFALFGGGAFGGQARFFDGAMPGFFFGAFARFLFFDARTGKRTAARDFLFFSQLAQHNAACGLLVARRLSWSGLLRFDVFTAEGFQVGMLRGRAARSG